MAQVFSTFSGKQANGVIANQHPAVFVYPHIGTQTVAPSGQRLGPSERGNTFLRNSRAGNTQPSGAVFSNPTPAKSGGCGCGK